MATRVACFILSSFITCIFDGTLLSNIIETEKWNGFDDFSTSLWWMPIITQSTTSNIANAATACCQKFLNGNVWNVTRNIISELQI